MTVYIPDGESVREDKLYQHSIEKTQLSQSSAEDIGLWVKENGQISNPDPGTAKFSVYRVKSGEPDVLVRTGFPSNPDLGLLHTRLTERDTDVVSVMKVVWEYTLAGVDVSYDDWFVVVGNMPEYDALTDSEKIIVRSVYMMFDDLYDSMNGGPHFQEEFQTEWNLNRYAQLMTSALLNINLSSQPVTNYSVGGIGTALPEKYHGVLIKALYIEVLKHFVRTYVEQPSTNGGPGVAYLDRRDYMQRWQSVLQAEQEDFKNIVKIFKMDHMGLGGGALLVSGGIYGPGVGGVGYAGSQWSAYTNGMRFWPQSNLIVMR